MSNSSVIFFYYGKIKSMNINITKIVLSSKEWLFSHGFTILIILISTWVLSRFLKNIVTKVVRRMIPRHAFASPSEEKKREDTLITIIKNFLGIFIWIAAVLGILYEIGVPIAPLLTGAGILGVAVGFGSQSLVKDVITGLFIIAENQFRINDYVCVGDYCGTVEGMTLRVTRLRHIDGTIHYIPNGEIKIASNKSKDYSKVDLKIGVGYDTDMEKLETIINQVGADLALDPAFKDLIIEAPAFLRIDDFLDSSISVHISGVVQPKQQYLVNGELRHRLKKIFEEKGIEIPYPTRVVHNHDN